MTRRAQNQEQRIAAWAAAVSVPFAIMALYGFGAASSDDIGLLFDGQRALALSTESAASLYRAFWLDILGFYLTFIPVTLYMWRSMQAVNRVVADLSAILGFIYILMGTFGAATMAGAYDSLHASYSIATPPEKAGLAAAWTGAIASQWSGLWLAETAVGAAWYLGWGFLLARAGSAKLAAGAFAIAVLWAVQFSTHIGGLREISEVAGNVVVLLLPLWALGLASRLFSRAPITALHPSHPQPGS